MNTKLNLLIIEDNEDDYLLIVRKIKKAGTDLMSTRIETSAALTEHLTKHKYSAVLSDNRLPDMDALDALKITRGLDKEIPFIIISGVIGEDKAVEAMKMGANDYIMKDKLERLEPALIRELKEAENRRKRKEAENDLQIFIYRSSHDLKGPLGSIKGLLEYVKQTDDMSIVKDHVDNLLKSAGQMEEALTNLLNLFKVNKSEYTIQEIDLKSLFDTVWNNIKYLIKDKNEIDFSINITEDAKLIESDPFLLKSIIQNLVENSIKYRNHHQSCFIEIKADILEESVRIAVKDNGEGIDKNLLDKIFELFFRGNLSAQGTGIGLYVSQKAVEKLGGKITVKSQKNIGSTFTIELPLNKEKV